MRNINRERERERRTNVNERIEKKREEHQKEGVTKKYGCRPCFQEQGYGEQVMWTLITFTKTELWLNFSL